MTFCLSYKTSGPLSDSRELSTDSDVWGEQVCLSFSTAQDGKGNIDGETVQSHHLLCNRVAIPVVAGGLGNKSTDLDLVCVFNNKTFPKVQNPRSKYGNQRCGPREWY